MGALDKFGLGIDDSHVDQCKEAMGLDAEDVDCKQRAEMTVPLLSTALGNCLVEAVRHGNRSYLVGTYALPFL